MFFAVLIPIAYQILASVVVAVKFKIGGIDSLGFNHQRFAGFTDKIVVGLGNHCEFVERKVVPFFHGNIRDSAN